MKSFPSAFVTAKNTKRGAKPVWILKITIGGINYYLSGRAISIPPIVSASNWPNVTAVNTLAWVKRWGNIQEGITGYLSEFHIADFSVELITDPDASPNIETLVTQNEIETSPAELYEWFEGISDPPQLMFRGYVKDVTIPSNTSVSLTIQDQSIRLQKYYVGRKATTALFPSIDPDDVGKVIPIPYGTVPKLQALAIDAGTVTTLTTDITAGATSFDVAASGITTNRTFLIDSEQVRVTGVSGYTLTVTRGYGGTTAVAHSKGAAVAEKKATPLVYAVSDVAVTSIGQVCAKVNDKFVDITSLCTKYTGQIGSQYATYPTMGIVTIADFAAVQKKVSLAPNDPTHDHPLSSQTILQYATGTGTQVNSSGGSPPTATASLTFPSSPGTFVQQSLHFEIGFTAATQIYIDGVLVYDNSSVPWTGTMFYDRTTASSGNSTSVQVRNATGGSCAIIVNVCSRVVTYDSSATANSTGVTITGNSVADTVVGTGLFVDVVRNVSDPVAVIQDICTMAGAGTVTATAPAGLDFTTLAYTFNGAITEYQTALYWCNYLALQCRSWFLISCSSPRLIVRPNTLTSAKTITACRVDKDGRLLLSRQKMAITETVNTINLLYNRDYSKTRSATSYQGSSTASDATSQTAYGVQEQANLFCFDFVTGSAMADSLRDFYLANYKTRRWLHAFDVFLDHSELEFGDTVTLGFVSGSPVGTVIRAEHYPGDYGRIDTVKLTVMV